MEWDTQIMAENKKELEIRKKPGTVNLEIKFAGGGEVPQELRGEFTNEFMAKKAISLYLDKRAVKRVSDTNR